MATVFGDTLTHIKSVLKDFSDTAKSGVMSASLPYVYALKEWLDTNKEFVKTKIQEFIQGAINVMEKLRPAVLKIIGTVKNVIDTVKPFVSWVIDNLPKLIPIITAAVAAFMTFSLVKGVIDGVKNAIMGIQTVLSMGPMGVIFLIITALIAGFTFLSQKVGGVENALELLKDALVTTGQTIMRFLLTPLNMTVDAIQGVLFAIGKVTKAKWAMDASEQLGAFQDKMNALLTGTTNTFLENGLAATYGDIPGNFGKIGEKYSSMAASITPNDNNNAGWQAILDKLDGVITAQEGTTTAVEDTGTAKANGSAPGLNFAAAGHVDIFGTARAGL
jgi:phage-related protein